MKKLKSKIWFHKNEIEELKIESVVYLNIIISAKYATPSEHSSD